MLFMSKQCVIYRAHFPNGKCYIGQSVNFAKRKTKHAGDRRCRALYNAIQKHGKPTYEIISSFDNQTSANICEMFWIAYHKAKGDCYNIKDGSANNNGGAQTEEHKRNISLSKKGQPNGRLGKKHTEETRRKMSLKSKAQQRINGRFA